MTPDEELFKIAEKLDKAADAIKSGNISDSLSALEKAAKEVARSFSGSWLGHHSRIYYADLSPAPPGANFSQEWGLKKLYGSDLGTSGDWRQWDPEDVKACIYDMAGKPDLDPAHQAAVIAQQAFDSSKSEIMSILMNELDEGADGFLGKLKDDLAKLEPMSKGDVAQHWSPKGQIMTRDMVAAGQGTQLPPHIDPLAEAAAIRHTFGICEAASIISRKAASHLERKSRRKKISERIGTNVFLGHGRSTAWRELKDFVEGRVKLPWDEFNRVPVAGVTNIARLSEMLDAAAIALLVMTAEDELADGAVQARMNVVMRPDYFKGDLASPRQLCFWKKDAANFLISKGLGR